jgi:hypothetical protein
MDLCEKSLSIILTEIYYSSAANEFIHVMYVFFNGSLINLKFFLDDTEYISRKTIVTAFCARYSNL